MVMVFSRTVPHAQCLIVWSCLGVQSITRFGHALQARDGIPLLVALSFLRLHSRCACLVQRDGAAMRQDMHVLAHSVLSWRLCQAFTAGALTHSVCVPSYLCQAPDHMQVTSGVGSMPDEGAHHAESVVQVSFARHERQMQHTGSPLF